MKTAFRAITPRSILMAVSVAAAMAALAGCERRPATPPPPAADTTPPAAPMAPASAASQ